MQVGGGVEGERDKMPTGPKIENKKHQWVKSSKIIANNNMFHKPRNNANATTERQ